MRYFIRNLLFIAIIVSFVADGKGFGSTNSNLIRGTTEFQKENFQKAIFHLKKHLRQFPKDYNTWAIYAAAHYHTGLPEKALKLFNLIIKKGNITSYNYYYKGLCYSLLSRSSAAKKNFAKASIYQDIYASRSVFELALLEYHEHNKKN